MNRIDKKILTLLQQNSQISNQELAENVDLSPSPCSRRVKQLEENGYIDKYVALLNPDKLDLKLTIIVSVGLSSHNPKQMVKFERAIKSFSEVVQCYLIAGQEQDYILKIATPDLNAYQRFLLNKLMQIEGVRNVKSSFILRDILDNTALPLNHL